MKRAIRKQMKQALEAIHIDHALQRSRRAAELLAGLEEFRSARVVMVYLTIPGEVDTAPIAHGAWEDGKTIVAPKACPDSRRMRPVVCPPGDEDLFHPHNGLRQPAGNEIVDLADIDLVVVPALAYDRTCHRLGRGGGFYDRFLIEPSLRAVPVGLAFAEQIIDDLPIQPNDQPVALVVTDCEIIRPARN